MKNELHFQVKIHPQQKKKCTFLRDSHTQLDLISAPEKLYLKKKHTHSHKQHEE